MFWTELEDAKKAQFNFNNYLALNSIFMTEELRTEFKKMNEALFDILLAEEQRHGQGYNEHFQKTISDNLKSISELFAQIEMAVQKRLRYEEA